MFNPFHLLSFFSFFWSIMRQQEKAAATPTNPGDCCLFYIMGHLGNWSLLLKEPLLKGDVEDDPQLTPTPRTWHIAQAGIQRGRVVR